MTDKNSLEILDLSCQYDKHPVLKNLHLALPEKTIGCLVGPSGCGKTTLLRCIAGLEPITSGQINLSNQVVSTPQKMISPHKRKISMVFQDYALFPHLTVEENIGFGLHCLSAKQCRQRINHMLNLVGLTTQAKCYPHTLSGGQQQRVALARALAVKPKLVLLDEPFSSLDPELRDRLAQDIRTILKEEKTTALIVTHDQHEAFAMGDFMGVMYDGKIIQWDTAYNLYHQPINRYVANFIGEGIFIKGRVLKSTAVETELGVLTGDQPVAGKVNEIVDVFLRPDDVIHDDQSPLTAEVVKRQFYGAFFHYTLKLPSGQILLAQVPSHHNHAIGEQIGIKFEIDHLVTFRAL